MRSARALLLGGVLAEKGCSRMCEALLPGGAELDHHCRISSGHLNRHRRAHAIAGVRASVNLNSILWPGFDNLLKAVPLVVSTTK